MQELWNVTELASLIGCHRDTVRARIKILGIEPSGVNQQGQNLYRAGNVLQLISLNQHGEQADPSRMEPKTRKDWFQSENERLKFEESERWLIPVDEVAREYSFMAKAVVQVLEIMPDVLERDCGLTPAAVAQVQSVIDELRDQMYRKVSESDSGEGWPSVAREGEG